MNIVNRVIKKFPQKAQRKIYISVSTIKSIGKSKIFGIGANKTGTTSLAFAMEQLGYQIGIQKTAEKFFYDWSQRNFKRLIRYCRTAEFFQDVPFSLPYTYIALDQAYPKSKFILTIRDSSEQWYQSITNFHAKLWGLNGRIPTKKDLQNATYIYKGRPWDGIRYVYNTPDDDPYQKDQLIKFYENHNNSILKYFENRKNDLLVLNVADPYSYEKLGNFLGKKIENKSFPWLNKT